MTEDTPKHTYHLKHHLQLAEFQPNAWQLEERQPQKYLPLEETKLIMVDSQELLDEMMTKLKQVNEFAINSEHHKYESFTGFGCWIQISTRTEDFIVDAIKLKEEITVLKEVCADRNILKVIHGSNTIILNLQRDYDIYIVNMLDIFEAAQGFIPKCTLPQLLKENCDIDVYDKKYGLTDWRVRPLPEDLIDHARGKTHYLLYLSDVYTNKHLHGKDTAVDNLKSVYERCTKLCGLIYAPPVFTEDDYKQKYYHNRKSTAQQVECYRLLYKWRYEVSREQDKSISYTLPKKPMLQISKKLPKNVEALTACCNGNLLPLVKQNITDVLTLVKKAIDYVPGGNVARNKKGKKYGELQRSTEDKKDTRDKNNADDKKDTVDDKKDTVDDKKDTVDDKKDTFCLTSQKPGHMEKDYDIWALW